MLNKDFHLIYTLLIMSIILSFCPQTLADEQKSLLVGVFSQQDLNGWLPKKFVKETQYSFVGVDGDMALKAVSRGAASGLIKKIRIDLEKFPFLNWRWRIENRLAGRFDEKQKQGDDYAARIYILASRGFGLWNSRTVNYVWAKNSIEGGTWPSAYARQNAVMMALQSSNAPVAVWQTEKRDVSADFKKLFGEKIRYIDAVMLMSDTDNTANEVTAYYGDLYFSAE